MIRGFRFGELNHVWGGAINPAGPMSRLPEHCPECVLPAFGGIADIARRAWARPGVVNDQADIRSEYGELADLSFAG